MGFWYNLWDMTKAVLKYPVGWFKPSIVEGDFPEDCSVQKELFERLLENGYRRTRWQLILPGQIAGLIKKKDGRQHHIRFYSDGSVQCELEAPRGEIKHWTGEHETGPRMMKKMLSSLGFSGKKKKKLEKVIRA